MNLPTVEAQLAEMTRIVASTPGGLARVAAFEAMNMQREQVEISTHHLFHAGMYARTITIPAGVALTGALIKRATILIFNGDAHVSNGDEGRRLIGYHVIPASAGRKQAFYAHADTQLTMLFPTRASDTAEAEREFTDEADRLLSRRGENFTTITGER